MDDLIHNMFIFFITFMFYYLIQFQRYMFVVHYKGERRKHVLAVGDDELDVRHDAMTTRRRRLPREGHVRECPRVLIWMGKRGDPASRLQSTSISGERGNKNMT
jgi:hypothetical protein